MILVFSSIDDPATNDVVRLLHDGGYGDKVIRLNHEESSFDDLQFEFHDDDFHFWAHGRLVRRSEIRTVWYRKGRHWLQPPDRDISIPGRALLSTGLRTAIGSEYRKAEEYLHFLLAGSARVLGRSDAHLINKLKVNSLARQVGFATPESLVTTSGTSISARLDSGRSYVTKPLSEGLWVWDFDVSREAYFSYTERIPLNLALDERVPMSLVQSEISKSFELRVFNLDGALFATAILSQEDAQTAVDFRKYNLERPNRTVPYDLPANVASKLLQVFELTGLNTGSADLIVDQNDEYVFLEINPAGQYGGVAKACNFPINEAIVKWLLK